MHNDSTVEDVSHLIEIHELVWIPLSDGRRLAARLWLPNISGEQPVPAVLEYLPYRRRDGTRGRDDPSHSWMAAQGYACIRVDISGSGDSDGLIEDEYVVREQDDALEIINWLVNQPWCSGSVGMIGISWGGFNGLQVAARQPTALKADWGSIFFTFGGLPPDPAIAGEERTSEEQARDEQVRDEQVRGEQASEEEVGEARWRSLWKQRLESLPLYPRLWLEHQRRDEFWKHGSVIEDYAAIKTPVLAVSGWADGYSNTVFRLVENLTVPCHGIVGPWGHKYPHQGVPGPAMGFLQECCRWWDRWLKDIDNGVDKQPEMRLYLQDAHPPISNSALREGRWLGLKNWNPNELDLQTYRFSGNGLIQAVDTPDTYKPDANLPDNNASDTCSIRSPQTTGVAAGEWCAYAMGKIAPELPMDQREDDAGSLTFTTQALAGDLNIVGRTRVHLLIASDKPTANVAVRLNDVRPDGSVTRVSYGVLNLLHRDSHETPEVLTPGEFYNVVVELNEVAQQIPAGHRLRISVSSNYWPMIWPSADSATLTLKPSRCYAELPTLPADTRLDEVNFDCVKNGAPLKVTTLAAGKETRQLIRDIETGVTTYKINRDDGRSRIDDIGTEIELSKEKVMSIQIDDPLSNTAGINTRLSYSRGPWQVSTESATRMTCDADNFYLEANIRAMDQDEVFFEREYSYIIKRDGI